MILKTLKARNFRQFYGNMQQINFSTSPNNNVTVIHAENGSGKTTILKMMVWCLFDYFDLTGTYMSERRSLELKDNEKDEVMVNLTFENEGSLYDVKRNIEYEKTDEVRVVDSNFIVKITEKTGKTKIYKDKEALFEIEKIFPEKMKDAFFLDAERIDTLSKLDNEKDMKNAIRTILKLEEYENALDDLEGVILKLHREARKYSNSDDINKLAEKLDFYEKKIAAKKDIVVIKNREIVNVQEIIKEVEEKYFELKSIEKDHKYRLEKEKQLDELKNDKKNLKKDYKDNFSSNSYFMFTNELEKKLFEIIEDKREKGELPSGIKEQFIDDLLNAGVCLCGTPLLEGSIERKKIENWKEKSVSSFLEEAYNDLSSYSRRFKEKRENYLLNIKKINENIEKYNKKENQIENELKKIEDKFKKNAQENLSNLENRRSEYKLKEVNLQSDKKNALNEIKNYEVKFEKLKRDIDKIFKEQKKFAEISNEIEYIKGIKIHIKKMLNLKTLSSRDKLQKNLEKIYSKFTRKGYKPIISENFTIKITKMVGEKEKKVDLSTGERQVTSISFIGALTDLVRNESKIMNDKRIYPIVLDSPFGELDVEHRKEIALGIPNLANQVIILVSQSQWEGAVEENMKFRAGERYYVKNYNPKNTPGINFEYSIVEVENDGYDVK